MILNLDQSDCLNYCFLFVLLFQIYAFSRKLFFIVSKNLILSLIDKVTTLTYNLAILISNIAPFVAVTTLYFTGPLFRSTSLNVLDVSDIIQYVDHVKSSFISQLISSNSRDLPKNYSDILMEQQLLRLIYCFNLVLFLLFLSQT